jgi:hypothetical protein
MADDSIESLGDAFISYASAHRQMQVSQILSLILWSARVSDAGSLLEHVTDAQLSCDLRYIDTLGFEGECRIACNDEKRRHFAQVGDDVSGDAIAEILLLGIGAHVDERQDADGVLTGGYCRGLRP